MERTQTVSSAIESPRVADEWPAGWDSFTTRQYSHYLNSHEVRRRLDYFFDKHPVSMSEGVILQRPSEGIPDDMYATVLLPTKRYSFEAFIVHGTKQFGYEATYDDNMSHDKVMTILDNDYLTVFQHPFSSEPSEEPVCEMVRAAEDAFISRRFKESQQTSRNMGRRLLSVR